MISYVFLWFSYDLVDMALAMALELRDNSDKLRDHLGLVQGWESVCWEVMGIPLPENHGKNYKNHYGIFLLFYGGIISKY